MTKLVKVKWVDSHSPTSYSWVNKNDLHHAILKIDTVGWVLYEDKETITLASQITEDSSDQVGGVISIPKCCILKRKNL